MTEPGTGIETPFTLELDRQRRLIRLTLRGLWDLATVEQYAAAVRDAVAGLEAAGIPAAAIRLLIDLRQQGVQPREVTERIQARLRDGASRGSRHAVLVSESTLHRLQAQRIGVLIDASFFITEADAIAWLLSESAPAGAPGEPQ